MRTWLSHNGKGESFPPTLCLGLHRLCLRTSVGALSFETNGSVAVIDNEMEVMQLLPVYFLEHCLASHPDPEVM